VRLNGGRGGGTQARPTEGAWCARRARKSARSSRSSKKGTVEELMPRLRERLSDGEATLRADTARGRLALDGLFGEQRLRVYSDGRIEGSAALTPETLAAPRRNPRA